MRAILLAGLLAAAVPAAAWAEPADVGAAVAAAASRTEANVKLDEGRKPAEVLSYLPIVEQLDSHTVRYVGKDVPAASKFIEFAMSYESDLDP